MVRVQAGGVGEPSASGEGAVRSLCLVVGGEWGKRAIATGFWAVVDGS